MLNSIISASYDDDFDDPFAPSDDGNNSLPTHDDWTGPPWTEEPTDETTSATDDDDDWANFDTDDDQPEALPITKMPDITPEETLMIQLVTILTMICLFLMIIRLHLMITTAEIATQCPVQKQKKRNVQSLLLK